MTSEGPEGHVVAAQTDEARSREDQKNLTSRAEAIARIIDPEAFELVYLMGEEPFLLGPWEGRRQAALHKAQRIEAEFLSPLLDGGCSSARDLRSDADAACVPSGTALIPEQDNPRPACPCRTCQGAWSETLPFGDRMMAMSRMFLCETCGNKRCPHATNHVHACTGSNAPGQPGSDYA
jgi:hypothetical protein